VNNITKEMVDSFLKAPDDFVFEMNAQQLREIVAIALEAQMSLSDVAG
jgi:hypothetical protein